MIIQCFSPDLLADGGSTELFPYGTDRSENSSMEDDKQAAAKMKASYSQRMMLQLIWGVLAIAVPCFQFVAGILPLLFPNIVIKTVGIIGGRKAA